MSGTRVVCVYWTTTDEDDERADLGDDEFWTWLSQNERRYAYVATDEELMKERVLLARGADWRDFDKIEWGSEEWKKTFHDRVNAVDPRVWGGPGDIGKILQWPTFFTAAKALIDFQYYEAKAPLKTSLWLKGYIHRHPTVS